MQGVGLAGAGLDDRRGGDPPPLPAGLRYLTDTDGTYLQDIDGAYLVTTEN